jgi:uncharacterized membrane protein YqjE
MATQPRIDRSDGPTPGPMISTEPEPQMRALLKQLASEGGDLVRGEMALAKLEMRDMARQLAADSAKVAASIALAMTGGLALLAAAIIGLGNLLDGRYALSALIIGVAILLIGGIMARAGIAGLKDNNHRPEETVRSLKRDKEWATRELQEFKEEVRS